MEFTLTPFALSGLLGVLTNLPFGLLVLFKSKNKKLGRAWFVFILSATIWCLGAVFIGGFQDPVIVKKAFQWSFCFGVHWIPVLFYRFVSVFCGINNKKIFVSNTLIALFFSLVTFSPIYFDQFYHVQNTIYWPIATPLYYVYVSWWVLFVCIGHWELIKAYRNAHPEAKNQIKYFFLATMMGYLGGSSTFLTAFGLDAYPYGNFTIFIYPFIMSYAILKYQLMDISIFLKRAVALILVYVGLLLVTVPLIYSLHLYLTKTHQLSFGLVTFEMILGSLILSMGPFLYAYFIKHSSMLKEESVATLTHELKSPLSSIASAVDILEDATHEHHLDPQYIGDYVGLIKKNSKRLQTYVNDLLVVLQQKPELVQLVKKQINLNELIENCMETYEAQAKMKGIHLNYMKQEAIQVQGDEPKLHQVISNLISNAVKFSDSGSITLQAERKNGSIHISIQDQGMGIPQKDLRFVFDRFYQSSNNKKGKGSGIGLTLAKLWVEAHDGKMTAESEGEGKGTTLSFTLPV